MRRAALAESVEEGVNTTTVLEFIDEVSPKRLEKQLCLQPNYITATVAAATATRVGEHIIALHGDRAAGSA